MVWLQRAVIIELWRRRPAPAADRGGRILARSSHRFDSCLFLLFQFCSEFGIRNRILLADSLNDRCEEAARSS